MQDKTGSKCIHIVYVSVGINEASLYKLHIDLIAIIINMFRAFRYHNINRTMISDSVNNKRHRTKNQSNKRQLSSFGEIQSYSLLSLFIHNVYTSRKTSFPADHDWYVGMMNEIIRDTS